MSEALEHFERAMSKTDKPLRDEIERGIGNGSIRLVEDGNKPDYIFGGSWPSRTPGARRAICLRCGEYVGLSPASAARIAAQFPDVPIICFPCGAKLAQG